MDDIRKSLKHRALSGMVWGYAWKFFEFVLAAVLSVVVGRALGPAVYGQYNLIMSIVNTFVFFSSFGFDAVLNKYLPQFMGEGKPGAGLLLLRRLFLWRLAVMAALAAAVLAGRGFLSFFFTDRIILSYAPFIGWLIFAAGLQNFFISFFNALLRIKTVTSATLASQASGVILLLVLFAAFGPSLSAVLQAVSFAAAVSLILFFNFARPCLPRGPAGSLGPIGPYLRFGFSVWQVTLLTYGLSTVLNVLLMGVLVKDPLEIGYYSTAILFSYLPGNLLTAWSGVILPSLSEARMRYGVGGIAEAMTHFSKVIFILVIPALFFLGRYAHECVIAVFGQKFYFSGLLVQIYVLTQFVGTLCLPHLCVNALYATDKEGLVLKVRCCAGVINLILVFALAAPFKSAGVLLAGCAAAMLQTMAEFALVLRNVPIRYPVAYLAKIVCGCVAALILLVFFPVRGLWGVAAAIPAYLIVLGGIFHFMKLLNNEDRRFLATLHPVLAFVAKHF